MISNLVGYGAIISRQGRVCDSGACVCDQVSVEYKVEARSVRHLKNPKQLATLPRQLAQQRCDIVWLFHAPLIVKPLITALSRFFIQLCQLSFFTLIYFSTSNSLPNQLHSGQIQTTSVNSFIYIFQSEVGFETNFTLVNFRQLQSVHLRSSTSKNVTQN